ncbi:MAG: NAD(P)-dependent oxidoreductase [Verrucomicrobia bacterium]|nr:NAD(P)-dependent oxidoreductase [Verrucomicrobiota bacterium]
MKSPSKQIGLVGLGLMGSALAERFLKSGFALIGFDVNAARRRALKTLGGKPLDSVAKVAAACGRIVFSLPTTEVVAEVIREMGDKLRPSSIIVDTTTGEAEETVRLGAKLAKRRIHYLDATVVGNSEQVRTGDVIVLAGGTRPSVAACRDVFESFARQTFQVGPCGSGSRMKLVVNLVLGLNRAGLAEGLAFAEAAGVSPKRALEILKSSAAYSRVMDTKGSKMLRSDFKPQARLSQHLKDVRLILSLGRKAGAKLPLSKQHSKLLEQVEAAGGGDLDNSAIIKAFK